jgi:hypothetical protein
MRYASKLPIHLTLVAVMPDTRKDRNLRLSEFVTRCIATDEIHEFLVANEWDGARDAIFNDVSYIGFMRFDQGGVIAVGEKVMTEDGHVVGEVIGFDMTHAPNHMNIVLASSSNQTGAERGFVALQKFLIEGYGR